MANQWFRMYAEFATDPKVQMLSEADQRRYVVLLCIRCSNDDETLHETMSDCNVAFQLRISEEEWAKTKAVLLSKKLIDKNNLPVAWDKRQYKSDSSYERVKAYRERKKSENPKPVTDDETLQKRNDNNDVTPPDTETDTETEKTLTGKPVESASADPCPHQAIVDLYHKTLPELAGIRDITDKRKTALRARWRSQKRFQNLDFWRQYFELVSESDFLMGRLPGKSWQADFDFLIKSDKFQKIIEGGYQGGGQ